MIELRHMDACHFVIIECRHLPKGIALKFVCIGLMLFLTLSCLGTIIIYKYYRNCSGICMQSL